MIVSWYSGGVTSAVACKIALDLYGADNVRIIFIDTQNEDDDTYRFMADCSKWYGKEIESITGISEKFPNIESVWRHYKTLNTASGAICSSTLKRDVRLKWQKDNDTDGQVFGFDMSEPKRARSMAIQHKKINPIFPLLLYGMSKGDCINMVQNAGIAIPRAYGQGFNNNNCLARTACIQGGIGYWKKIKVDRPDAYSKMAAMEHELTDAKGEPVTMLKDQSNEAKKSGNYKVFLEPHPDWPNVKTLSEMKGRAVKPLMECNGFCGSNDLNDKRNETEDEINFQI